MENTIENALKFVLSSDHSIRMAYIHSLGAGDWDKLSDLLHSYASQTAPKLVLPSEDGMSIHPSYDEAKRNAQMSVGDRMVGFIYGWKAHQSELIRLNPHLTDPGYTDPK